MKDASPPRMKMSQLFSEEYPRVFLTFGDLANSGMEGEENTLEIELAIPILVIGLTLALAWSLNQPARY